MERSTSLLHLVFLVLLCQLPFCTSAATGAALGLPVKDEKNTADAGVIALGQRLFFDRRLSINGTLSCAMCHIPEQGFTQHHLATPVGLEGRAVKRNSPTLLNVAFQKRLFHDGREFSLENQVWSPLLSEREMGNLSIGLVIEKISALEDYEKQFAELLGEVNSITIGQAIAAYERSLIAADSPFDRWFFAGVTNAVSEQVKAGYTLFARHGCINCHLIGTDSALFTDHQFHDTGIGFERSMNPKEGTRIIQLTDTIKIETDEQFEGEVFNDLGRYEVTGIPQDRWRYKTPGLRNIALTAPYMHDGTLANLRDVIGFYMGGGFNSPGRDKRILPFTLDEREVSELVAFLESLTSHHIDALVKSARQTAIGDNKGTSD